MKKLSFIFSVGAGIILVLVCFYCFIFTGKTNHVSFDLNKILFIFSLASILSGIFFQISSSSKKNGMALIIIGILFLLVIIFNKTFNIMITYEEWIERGMPDKYSFFSSHKYGFVGRKMFIAIAARVLSCIFFIQ